MMKITGLSHLFKWENLHNWWLTKYFFAPLYIYIYHTGLGRLNMTLINYIKILSNHFGNLKYFSDVTVI